MPSDTFAAGIEADFWKNLARNAAGKIDALLLYATSYPTDSHALDAYALLERMNVELGITRKPRTYQTFERAASGRTILPPILEREFIAASTPTDTDTPVDPGVEGVREARRLARTAFALEVSQIDRDALLTGLTDDEIDSIIDGVLSAAALAAKPIAGMDAGEVEERVARIIAPNCNWSRGVKFDALYAPGRELALTKAKAILAILATNQEDGK